MMFHIFQISVPPKKKNGLLLLLGREETLGRLWGRSTLRQQSCKSAACFWYPSPTRGFNQRVCEQMWKNKIFILIVGRSTWRNRRRNAYFRLPPSTLFPLFFFRLVPKISNPQAVFLRFVSGSPSSCSRNSPCFFWPSDDTMEMSWQILTSDISRFGKDLGIFGGGRLMCLSIYPNTEGWLQISCNSVIYKPLKKYMAQSLHIGLYLFTQLPCGICAIYFEL